MRCGGVAKGAGRIGPDRCENVTGVSDFGSSEAGWFASVGPSEGELSHLCDTAFGAELFPVPVEPVDRRSFLVLRPRRAGQRTVLAARLAMSTDGESDGAAFSPPVRVRTVQFCGEGGVAFPGEAGESS